MNVETLTTLWDSLTVLWAAEIMILLICIVIFKSLESLRKPIIKEPTNNRHHHHTKRDLR